MEPVKIAPLLFYATIITISQQYVPPYVPTYHLSERWCTEGWYARKGLIIVEADNWLDNIEDPENCKVFCEEGIIKAGMNERQLCRAFHYSNETKKCGLVTKRMAEVHTQWNVPGAVWYDRHVQYCPTTTTDSPSEDASETAAAKRVADSVIDGARFLDIERSITRVHCDFAGRTATGGSGYYIKIIEDVSMNDLDKCMGPCTMEQDFDCRAFWYDESEKKCFLSDLSNDEYSQAGHKLVEDIDKMWFDKSCTELGTFMESDIDSAAKFQAEKMTKVVLPALLEEYDASESEKTDNMHVVDVFPGFTGFQVMSFARL